jgi:GAF domain-containing protein
MNDEPLSLDEGLLHLSRLVLRDETLDTTLQRIVDVASRAIPDVIGASITLKRGHRPYTAVATNDDVLKIDAREYDVDEGPCISAMETAQLQILDDVDHEPRWPRFAQVCKEEGLASSLGAPLCVGNEPYGAMNVYATAPHAFTEEHQQAALLLAEQASIALENTRTYSECSDKVRQLQEALESRVVIEQAKGALMATERCDAEAAFQILKDRSQRSNRKIRVVAEEVVANLHVA